MFCAGKLKTGEWKIFRSKESVRGLELDKLIWFEPPTSSEYMEVQACFGQWPLRYMFHADQLIYFAELGKRPWEVA